MDANENLTLNKNPVKARKKHIVLFVIACILLTAAVFFACPLISLWMSPPQVEDPTGDPLAMGAVVFVGMGLAMAAYMSMFLFVIHWMGGIIIMALLALDRKDKPKWLWEASLTITLVFLIPVMILVVSRIAVRMLC